MNNSNFGELLSYYFNNYLQIQKNYSQHTIRSYKLIFKQLIKFLVKEKNVTIKKLSLNDFTRTNVIDFLNDVEKNNTINTRNQRLACIKSFCNYIIYEDISNINNIRQILQIPKKKYDRKEIDYLTKEELNTFLSIIDTNKLKGVRDYTLITLLYDSAARAEEITNIRVNDLILDGNPSVKLYGKRKKYRTVPITEQTKKLLVNYISLFKLNNFSYLFSGNKNLKCSTKMISHIINKYAKKSEINKNIHPHIFRHTRAMHMLESGVELVYIRDILGHTNITTTEIYARTNIETKRKVLENVYQFAENNNITDSEWNKNEELIKSLLDIE